MSAPLVSARLDEKTVIILKEFTMGGHNCVTRCHPPPVRPINGVQAAAIFLGTIEYHVELELLLAHAAIRNSSA